MDWIYKDKFVEELPEFATGFIYVLYFEGGLKYVGKKSCFSTTHLPALKSGEVREGAIRVSKRSKIRGQPLIKLDQVTKENKWREYEGSSDNTEHLTLVSKEILEFAPTYRSLTYLEVKYQFVLEVLEKDEYLNMNINNNWFKGKLL